MQTIAINVEGVSNIATQDLDVVWNFITNRILYYSSHQPCINLLNPTGHVIHQQFNIQQLYVLLTLYLCVLYLSEKKQRLAPLTA